MEFINRLEATEDIVLFVNDAIKFGVKVYDYDLDGDYVIIYGVNGEELKISCNGTWVEPSKYYVSEINTYIDLL